MTYSPSLCMYLSHAEGKTQTPQHSICCVGRESVRTEFPGIVRPPNPAYLQPPVNARGQVERTQSGQPHHSACSSNPLFKSLLLFPLPFEFPACSIASFNWSYSHWFFSFLLFRGCIQCHQVLLCFSWKVCGD
jgi:hypothetical protein